ncbi:hypothetical protein C8P63_10859 [Melghirimyces profundicolus]|uniref:WD40 repeat protein n=1 Tax=Melghirimyces profundicolus TaxID=1242148 RepID=A0A2T6BXE2_9BACL|nr:hypothetical protein C8P63_10859 [Melghirimyces profundicolus]
MVPYLFQGDRFYFRGKTDRGSDYYIFDLTTGRLVKEDWTRRYGDSKEVYHLGEGVKVRILDKQSGRSLVLERDGGTTKITDSLSLSKEPVSVSPAGNAFIYTRESGADLDLHLYSVEDGRDRVLRKGVNKTAATGADWVRWSPGGEYFLMARAVYETKDAKKVMTLAGNTGVWSPTGARLAYVAGSRKVKEESDGDRPSLLGDRLVVLDMESGKSVTYYRTEPDQWIAGPAVWDPEGRYLAFPTGKKVKGDLFFGKIHVTDGKMFHYVENEQNLMPTRLNHLTLSSGSDYLSYTVNGILKLIDLRSLESRVYDVYSQVENQVQSEADYIRFGPDGVWLAREHEILYVSERMEKKQIYQTDRWIHGFYLSEKRNKLLLREGTENGEVLKLVRLQQSREAPE